MAQKRKSDKPQLHELETMPGFTHGQILRKKYIYIECQEIKGRRTKVFLVRTNKDSVLIATIKWHPGWRNFSFFPEPGTIWEENCLDEIIKFLGAIKDLHGKKPK